ncbi:MAG: AAA family ATPase [Solirubrobacteraceae bacterium]|nr:AAA family ATPase [Solirubrobacteraceae bacterium]
MGAPSTPEHVAARAPFVPPLVGRARPLAALDDALDDLARGRGGRLVVEGPRGTGRTRLLGEASRIADGRGLPVAAVRAVTLDRELPFGVATRLLRSALRAVASTPEACDLRHLLDDGPPADDAAPLVEGGLAAIHGLARATTDLVDAHGPLVLSVDDAHRVDPLTWRLLSYLGALAPDLAILVLVAWDTTAAGPASDAGAVMGAAPRLVLDDLSADDAGAVVRRRLPGAAAAFVTGCHALTHGNPAQLVGLIDAARDAGVPTSADGVAALRTLSRGTVGARLVAEVRGEGVAALDLARGIAFLGDGTSLRDATALADLDPEAAAAAADRLVRAGIVDGARGLRFVHPLRPDALRDELGAFTRSRWHARAGRVLAEHGRIDEAGAHLLRADPSGDDATTAVLRAAADAAAGRGDGETAARLLRRALQEPPSDAARPALLLALARVAGARGEPVALDLLEEALGATDDDVERAEALRDAARLHYARGDIPRAAQLAVRARDAVPADGPLGPRMAATWMLCASMDPSTHRDVHRILDRLAAQPGADGGTGTVGRRDAEVEPEVDALLALHLVATLGSPDDAVARARRALERDATRNPGGPHLVLEIGLGALLHAGRLDDVTRAATDALERSDVRGSLLDAASAAFWRGLARLERGDVDGAAGDVALVRRPTALGWRLHAPHAAILTARVALAHGDVDAARVAIDDPDGALVAHPMHRLVVAEVALATGDPTAARVAAEDAGRLLVDGWGVRSPAVAPWRSIAARAALAEGDVPAARALAADAADAAGRSGVPAAHARALRTLALVTGGTAGIAALRHAADLVAGGDATAERLRVAVDLGAALRRAGERRAARAVLAPARDEAERLGLVALATRAADEQRASGARPRRVATMGVASLTPSELRIARRAATGETNRQIAAALFLTPKTVEWHLGRVYRKLDIDDRRGIAGRLAEPEPGPGGGPDGPGRPTPTVP